MCSSASAIALTDHQVPWPCTSHDIDTAPHPTSPPLRLLIHRTLSLSLPDASSSHSMHGPASSELGVRHACIGETTGSLDRPKYISYLALLRVGRPKHTRLCEHELLLPSQNRLFSPSVTCLLSLVNTGKVDTTTGVAAHIHPVIHCFFACHTGRRFFGALFLSHSSLYPLGHSFLFRGGMYSQRFETFSWWGIPCPPSCVFLV